MSSRTYSGFIFQNQSPGDYLVAIGLGEGKYWGIQAISRHGSYPYYLDTGNITFPNDIKDIVGSFQIMGQDFGELLKVYNELRDALKHSRQLATERMKAMDSLDSQVDKESVARTFGETKMPNIARAEHQFYEQCDRLFTSYLMTLI